MLVEDLIPTQDGYRLDEDIRESMLDFVSGGGVYDQKTIQHHSGSNSLIAITRFPDGELYLRDGLHRATSIYIAREGKRLLKSEYVIENMTYKMYLEPAPEYGWFTPFDPRTEVRLPDFLDFKSKVEALHPEEVIQYILDHKFEYATTRNSTHDIKSLAELWGKSVEERVVKYTDRYTKGLDIWTGAPLGGQNKISENDEFALESE